MEQEGASSSKRNKMNDDSNETGEASTSANAVVVPNIVQTAAILKLDIDCFEETFDFLPLVDLLSVGQTCKRLQQVSGYIINQSYGGLQIGNNLRNICLTQGDRSHVIPRCFDPYLRKLSLGGKISLRQLDRVQANWKSIRQLEIIRNNLKGNALENLQRISQKLEHLKLDRCTIDGDFHDLILKYCTKIKRLSVTTMWSWENESLIGNGNVWLFRKYPTLEHIEINAEDDFPKIGTFLGLNPNIRKLSIIYAFMMRHADLFMSSKAKLDELVLYIQEVCFLFDAFDTLQTLHQRGFYKRLRLYAAGMNQQHIDRLALLNIVKLQAGFEENVILSSLNNLEELYVYDSRRVMDFSKLATNLQHLRQIEFYCESFDAILPFVSHARNLKRIKFEIIQNGAYFNTETKVVKLRALNKEREKLSNAERITIYVYEEIYLATKWSREETDFSLIRLRRLESVDWTPDYIE